MFPKRGNDTAQQARHSGVTSGAMPGFSVLGADMAIKGDVSAKSDLHIDGRIEGDVACASLVQGESSEIIGAVSAGTARLAGSVCGTITVGELVILKTARIEGDMRYDTLTIEPGAQVDGRVSLRGPGPAEPVLTLASSAT